MWLVQTRKRSVLVLLLLLLIESGWWCVKIAWGMRGTLLGLWATVTSGMLILHCGSGISHLILVLVLALSLPLSLASTRGSIIPLLMTLPRDKFAVIAISAHTYAQATELNTRHVDIWHSWFSR
jgi:hypothetical protein